MNTQANVITINEFVSREIIYCVSSLVSTLVSASGETGAVGDISQDELFDLCGNDDWQTPAEENGWGRDEEGEIFKTVQENDDEPGEYVRVGSWQEACEHDDLEPYRDEGGFVHLLETGTTGYRMKVEKSRGGDYAVTAVGEDDPCGGEVEYCPTLADAKEFAEEQINNSTWVEYALDPEAAEQASKQNKACTIS